MNRKRVIRVVPWVLVVWFLQWQGLEYRRFWTSETPLAELLESHVEDVRLDLRGWRSVGFVGFSIRPCVFFLLVFVGVHPFCWVFVGFYPLRWFLLVSILFVVVCRFPFCWSFVVVVFGTRHQRGKGS